VALGWSLSGDPKVTENALVFGINGVFHTPGDPEPDFVAPAVSLPQSDEQAKQKV